MARFDLDTAALRDYRPDVDEPDDFDDFWESSIAAARGRGASVTRLPAASRLTAFDVADVTFPGYDGDPVRAWLVTPKDPDGPLPAVVEFVGYGRGRGLAHERLHWPAAGFAQLIVDTRGQGSQWGTGGGTPDPHGAGPAASGFLTRGIESPAAYYYRRVFVDAVRAVDAVRTFDEVDATRVAVTGNSQGGAIAIAAAGLSDGLVGALPTAPILCHVRRGIGLTDADPHAEVIRYLSVHRTAQEQVFRTLSYFDGVNFAKRAGAPALFGAGHMDTISPPSTVYAACNHWRAGAEMIGYEWNGHEGGEGLHWQHQADWLLAHVNRPSDTPTQE
jgi:cephalosporin-C deacetylase